MYKYLIPALIGACALFVLHTPERVAERQPASDPVITEGQTSLVKKTNLPTVELFEFDRRIKATLSNNDVLADAHYSGVLIINWKEKNRALITFTAERVSPVVIDAEISENHEILGMKAGDPVGEEEENALLFLKDIISIYAFNTNEDTTGKYLAEIKEEAKNGNSSTWVKRKTKYSSGDLALFKFNKSIPEIHLTDDLLNEASGLEEIQMDMKNAAGSELSSTSGYVLKKISLEEALKKGVKTNIQSIPENAVNVTLRSTLKVARKKVDWDQFKHQLANADQLKGNARVALFHQCIKALKDHPEKLQEWLAWMSERKASPERHSLGISTLANVGTPQAQSALISEFQKHPSHLILNAMATSEAKLTDETRMYLQEYMNNNGNNPEMIANAAYTLGAAKNEKDVKILGERSIEASSIGEKKIFLDALGNNGNTAILPYIVDHLRSDDPAIREKAIFSLRFVNDLQVKSIFEKSIEDPSANVRQAVVRAIPFQGNPHLYDSLLSNCARRSFDSNLRPMCAQTLEDI